MNPEIPRTPPSDEELTRALRALPDVVENPAFVQRVLSTAALTRQVGVPAAEASGSLRADLFGLLAGLAFGTAVLMGVLTLAQGTSTGQEGYAYLPTEQLVYLLEVPR